MIELKQVYPTGTVRYDGGETISLAPGQRVTFLTHIEGDVVNFFEYTAPPGKVASVAITVSLTETSAP